jgi:membrane associated rhomboid family serine protease
MNDVPPADGWGGRLRAAPMCAALAGVCVAFFFATLGICGARLGSGGFLVRGLWSLEACQDVLVDLGALSVARVWLDGAWWRVLTAGLLHGSVLHLILNTWSLWVVGEWAERAWGARGLLALFVVSSVGGCLASQAWAEAPMVVGASAGIMGIAGALWVARVRAVGPTSEVLAPLSARGLGTAIAVLVGLGFVVPVIAQAGHLGGLAIGGMLGWAWSGRPRAGVVGVALCLGALGGLLALAARPGWRLAHDEVLGYELLERDRDEEAVERLERVLAARPDEVGLANDVAYGYAKAGVRLVEAERLVRRALEEEPGNPNYLDTLGWVLCRRGDAERGTQQLERAVALAEGDDAEILAHLEACGSAGVDAR